MNRIAQTITLLVLFCASSSVAQFGIVIDAQKDSFYAGLTGPQNGYIRIPHTDFLPRLGPRPDDAADLSADVWAAWDETFLYVYAEVRDDTLLLNNVARPNNDCLELKFDPDPTKKAWTGIVNARLSALDSADAEEREGVDNLYKERHLSLLASASENYARRRTTDGYALEMRLAWEWITAQGREVNVGIGSLFGLSVTVHDNDTDDMDAGIQWSAGMADDVWSVPQMLGTVQFLEEHRLKFIRVNAIDSTSRPGKAYLSLLRFEDARLRQMSIENWKYHPGDNPEWVRPEYDDRNWEMVHSLLREGGRRRDDWEGIGWFRSYVAVDSTLRNVPVAFRIWQGGASEIYVDGRLVRRFGSVGATGEDQRTNRDYTPRFLVFPGSGEHVVAVRYSNVDGYRYERFNIAVGFVLSIFPDADAALTQRVSAVRDGTLYQTAFSVVPLLLALLHLFLFAYYPRARENLYFTIAMLLWGVVIFGDFHNPFTETIDEAMTVALTVNFVLGPSLVFILLTIYEMLLGRIPKQIWFFVVAGLGISIWGYVDPVTQVGLSMYILIGLTALEMIRVFFVSGRERRRQHWITAVGLVVFMLAMVVQILMSLEVLPRMIFYPYGLILLSIAVSVELARNFARTRRRLEAQLVQVQELSAKTLEQERRAKEHEIARQVLEADNARKTRELEEARKLQLSMLPNKLPSVPSLDIAVYMKPATEVGGDYYDFHSNGNGSLTVAVGDATGHGMKAGTMVATTKGLFSASGNSMESLEFFKLCTRTIKEMHLGNLYMALMIARIQQGKMTVASAGMPPLLIHRAATGQVGEIVLKGMPLGAHAGFPYAEKETSLYPDDTVLMMSDGFSELFNHKRELIGPARVKELFAETADQSPNVIIDHLTNEGDKWRNGEPVHDDITFVVLKAKG
jgi:serine phosphatase RsbU (regulator of sigma subunit)